MHYFYISRNEFNNNIDRASFEKNNFVSCFIPPIDSERYLIFENYGQYAKAFNNYTALIYRIYELKMSQPLDKIHFTEYFISELEYLNNPYLALTNVEKLNKHLNYITNSRSDIPLQVIDDCDLNDLTYIEFYFSPKYCTYEYNSIVVNKSNVNELKGNNRICLLIQNIDPDVRIL